VADTWAIPGISYVGIHDIERDLRERRADDVFADETLPDQWLDATGRAPESITVKDGRWSVRRNLSECFRVPLSRSLRATDYSVLNRGSLRHPFRAFSSTLPFALRV
jgi:hypothetical protein